MYLCFSFAVIGELDSEKQGPSLGTNKLREFSNKCVADKRKLLVEQFGTDIDRLFPDSLDDVGAMSPSDQLKKSGVPIIPRENMKRKLDGESSEAAAPKMPKPTADSAAT